MQRFSPTLAPRPVRIASCILVLICTAVAQTSIRSVKVLGGKSAIEIEIEASDKVVPQTQILSGPDRLVVDFPNATPGGQLRSQSVNLGDVKDVRFGLFQAKPPVTRLVLDLRAAQSFQVFPYGRTVIIKVAGVPPEAGSSATLDSSAPGPASRPGLVAANYTNRAEPIQTSVSPNDHSAGPALDVSFRDGLLAIRSNKSTLSEVLYAVHQRTGAEVSIAAGAEQEKVVADIGPGPAPEVLAQLLNGSKFNFLILNAANDPRQLDRIILSPRPERVITPPSVQSAATDDEDVATQPPPAPAQAPARFATNPPGAQPPTSPPEVKPADEDAMDK
jgi:hypothetical protein